ncbi:unnamed protein product [Cladocopium goreaui]|uniref:Uncharacterized protein n=1 Tax=Cladocopium goreaui TaxID=2562237 RepID=A0A9P1CWU9_9DINO|nr:unnamed protein product [Cladocopium goreaui]
MSDTSTDSATHEPLRAVIADAAAADAHWSESQHELINGVEETLRQLEEQIGRIAEGESAEEQRRHEADAHRRRLEHDLKLARTRVHDLEEALQQRTEELLKAQAANNALAAELQAAEIDPSDEVAESSASPAEEPHGDDEASVTERFAKLRGDKMSIVPYATPARVDPKSPMVATSDNLIHTAHPGSPAGAVCHVVSADGRAIPERSLEEIERLDDTVFAALAGDPGALDAAAVAWRQAHQAVDRRLLDEARTHYVRRARSRWRRAQRKPEERIAHAFAALEILGLFGERPEAA